MGPVTLESEQEEPASVPAKKTKSRANASVRSAPKTPEEIAQIWQNWATKNSDFSANPYRMSSTFAVEDVLEHPTFGKGFVSEVASPKKIHVIFESGVKKLVHRLQV